jgi:hypothetical protein
MHVYNESGYVESNSCDEVEICNADICDLVLNKNQSVGLSSNRSVTPNRYLTFEFRGKAIDTKCMALIQPEKIWAPMMIALIELIIYVMVRTIGDSPPCWLPYVMVVWSLGYSLATVIVYGSKVSQVECGHLAIVTLICLVTAYFLICVRCWINRCSK